MKKKYVVVGGYIYSINDGERHYINANRLCMLYSVHPEECYLFDGDNHMRGFRNTENLQVLGPKADGNYSIKGTPMVGKHVEWERVKCKASPSMHESEGFGVLTFMPKPGSRLHIVGDYGVTTSNVLSVEEKDGELTVVTQNSTYVVTRRSAY